LKLLLSSKDIGAMSQNERKHDLEEERFELEKDKFKLEKTKFLITTIAVSITLATLLFGLFKFFSDRKQEYNALYRITLAKVLSGDEEIQKVALIEISKFKDKIDEYVPVLINLLNDYHKEDYITLDKYFIISFMSTGKPMIDALALSNSDAQKIYDSDLCKSTGWAICQMLKNKTEKMIYKFNLDSVLLTDDDLHNVNISNVLIRNSELNNINFDNSVLKASDFSNTIFRNCSFWKTKFSRDVNLEGTQFIDCNLQESIFECNIKKTIFKGCNVLDLLVTDKNSMNEDTFAFCQNSNTVKFKQI